MGKALRRDAEARRKWRRTRALACLTAALAAAIPVAAQRDVPPAPPQRTDTPIAPEAPLRLEQGRFTAVGFPGDQTLMRTMLARAGERDSFPWLPRPKDRVLIAVAPDERRFREWIGPGAPEWGAAIAFPAQNVIVVQGRDAASDAGDPTQVLRHELAHLALHEALGDLPPLWFDEGYASVAAGEWGREEAFATSLALLFRGMPSLDSLDAGFTGGPSRAQSAYALAHRAVAELSVIDRDRGLTLFFEYWRESRSLDAAIRRSFGMTQSQFEERWRSRTRRQYGALAVFADLAVAAALILTMVLPLYIARRRRDRRRLDALRAADAAAERAERDAVLGALLDTTPRGGNAESPDAPR